MQISAETLKAVLTTRMEAAIYAKVAPQIPKEIHLVLFIFI